MIRIHKSGCLLEFLFKQYDERRGTGQGDFDNYSAITRSRIIEKRNRSVTALHRLQKVGNCRALQENQFALALSFVVRVILRFDYYYYSRLCPVGDRTPRIPWLKGEEVARTDRTITDSWRVCESVRPCSTGRWIGVGSTAKNSTRIHGRQFWICRHNRFSFLRWPDIKRRITFIRSTSDQRTAPEINESMGNNNL